MKKPVKALFCLLIIWSATLIPVFGGGLSAGYKSVLYVNDSGDLTAWGANAAGQLGDGTTIDRPEPIIPDEAGPWSEVSTSLVPFDGGAESVHSLAIKADGTLWAWGDNTRGQLGQGDTENRSNPTRVGSGAEWKAVAAGSGFSMALKQNGEIWVWGDNSYGQLGSGVSENFSTVPLRLADKDGDSTPDTFIAIAAGANHALAIHASSATASYGQIYAWGRNGEGQLGLGHKNTVAGPRAVSAPNPGQSWQVVEAGVHSSFALDAYSKLYAWGQGSFGSLGVGDNFGTAIQQVSSPTATANSVSSAITYERVAAGADHTIAVVSGGGAVYGTGVKVGLGAGDTGGADRYTEFTYLNFNPPSGAGIDAIGAGLDFSILELDTGVVLSTGNNDRGQLGIGTTDGASDFTPTVLGAVDLEIDAITLNTDPAGVTAGSSISFDLIIRNNGTGEIAAGTAGDIRLALGLAEVFGADGQIEFTEGSAVPLPDAIGPNEAVTLSVTRTLPADLPAGDYRLLAEADTADALDESDETNNRFATEPVLPLLSDLRVEFAGAIPSTVSAGDTLTFDVTFINDGPGAIPAGAGSGFAYRVILSEFADEAAGTIFELPVDGDAPDVESPFVSGLSSAGSADAEKTRTVTVTVPESATVGEDFFIGLIVDSGDVVTELSETNNTAFTATRSLSVTGLSVREALDLPDPPADDPATTDVDESLPAALTSGGDADWFGQADADAPGPDADSLSSPQLSAGEFASLTFQSDAPRVVTFWRKAETSSSQNRLFFGENRNPIEPENRSQASEIFGTTEWAEVAYVIPKDQPVGFFYEQGVDAPADRVLIDHLRVGPAITEPDFVIDSIEYQAGDYVLERDRLTVLVRGQNRGALVDPLPENLKIRVWLSRDRSGGGADDVLLGDLNSFQILDNGARFVYQARFNLPEGLEDANYHVLARVDAENVVDEFTLGGGAEPAAFTPEDNNWRVSDAADVNIRRLPDLWVTKLGENTEFPIDFDAVETEPIFVGGPTDLDAYSPNASLSENRIFAVFIKEPLLDDEDKPIRGEIAIRFDVVNRGLGDQTGQSVDISAYLLEERDSDVAAENLLATFTEDSGFASKSGRTYELTTNIPEDVVAGRFYYVAVVVDETDQVEESDEANNSSLSEDKDVFVGEVPLEVALNDDVAWASIDGRSWDEGYASSFDTGGLPDSPWFGQKEVFNNDSTAVRAAAQSGPVEVGQSTFMTTDITEDDVDFPLFVSFRWKTEAGPFDQLRLEIRDGDNLPDAESSIPYRPVANEDPDIVGNVPGLSGVADWRKASFIIQKPGDYRLRWTYIEDDDGTLGTAWVDSFSLESPDLLVDSVEISNISNPGSLDAGDSFDLGFTVENNGDAPVNRALVQIRLVKEQGEVANLDWTDASFNDVVLVESFEADLSSNTFGYSETLTLPDGMTEDADFYVAVWVDYLDTVPEKDETNNLQYSATQLEIRPQLTIKKALDFDEGSTPEDSVIEWLLTGDGRWFPVDLSGGDPVSASGEDPTEDAMQAPDLQLNKTAGFEAIVQGPKLLTFWWRARGEGPDLTNQPNTLCFKINGQNTTRELDGDGTSLSPGDERLGQTIQLFPANLFEDPDGDTGWVREAVFIPAGAQSISWVYDRRNQNEAGEFWVEQVQFEDIDKPDFAIRSVDYNPGLYGLERDRFPLQVQVVNRGTRPEGFDYNDLELNVRLSENQTLGQDDLLVGTLPLADVLDGGQQIVFSGDLDLPVNLPASDYYLLVEVKSLDPSFQEYEDLLSNNVFVSNDFDVEIVALPRLDTELVGFDQDKIYYPKESLLLDWNLLNIGLGDVPAGSDYTQRIELWRFDASETEFLVSNADFVREMASITASEFLLGALDRDGDTPDQIDYLTRLRMPSAPEILADLGVVPAGLEEEDAQVTENLDELEEHLFFFVLVRDNELPQSSDLAIRYFPGQRFVMRAVPNTQTLGAETGTFLTYDIWREQNQSVFDPEGGESGLGFVPEVPGEDPEGVGASGAKNFIHYALNLPLDSAPGINLDAQNTFTKVGTFSNSDGDYRSLTFPVVRGAVDLKYIVEVSNDDGETWEEDPLVEIQPPYLDNRGLFRAGYLGAQSLTSSAQSNSLINTEVNAAYTGAGDTDQPIASVLDQNYTALVTVRDIQELTDVETDERTLRLRVVHNERVLSPELELAEPGSGTIGDSGYVKGAAGFEVVDPDSALNPGDTLEVNFDIWSLGEIPQSDARVQVRLVENKNGSTETLDWSSAGFTDLVLFDGILPLDRSLDSSDYGAFREQLEIPENVLETGSYYVAVWVDYLDEVSEFDETNNLAFSATDLVDISNPLTIPAAIDSDTILLDLDGDPGTPDETLTWTQAGDAPWFPLYDEVPEGGSAPEGAFEGEALSSPELARGQTAKLRTSFGDVPRMVEFDWFSLTSSPDSALSVRTVATGETLFEASGISTGWETASIIVPAGAEVEFRYTQGTANSSDRVFLDRLEVVGELASPDFVLSGIDLTDENGETIPDGGYVLDSDPLYVNVSTFNQGLDSTGDFSIKIYLSRDSELDAGDVLIRNYFEEEGEQFLSGNGAVNGFAIDLPNTLAAGSYYLIAVINQDEDDLSEDGRTDNNTLATPSPAVEIFRLPDLVIRDFSAQPDFYRVEEAGGGRGLIDFEFTIENRGLADVDGPFAIRVLLSPDNVIEPETDYVLLEYTFNGSLAQGSSQLIDPDSVEIRNNVPLGEYQFISGYIDSAGTVLESNESNNGSEVVDNDFVFSLRTLREGLDLDPAGTEVILNDENAPYASDAQPWVVQSAESLDGEDAVTNVLIDDDESASFSVEVNPASDVRASFWWKVSSQNEQVEGVNQRDILSFSVDGVEAVAPIFGTDNPDWRRVEVPLSAGPHTLTWTYTKDDQGSGGEDRGWVDRLVITELPNLQVSAVSLDESPVYRPDGDTIDSWSVTVTNSGASAIPAGTAFDVALRVMPQADWSDADARTLLTITDSDGLAAGASRTYTQASHGTLALPSGDYSEEFYYYGAYADWSLSDPASGTVTESFEDDNLRLSGSAGLQVGLPDVVTSAVNGMAGPYNYTDAYALDLTLDNIGEGVLLDSSSFEARVFLVPQRAPGVEGSAQAHELGNVTVSGSEVAAGDSLPVPTLNGNLPYGIANGSYYIGVQLDPANSLAEQGALSLADGDPRDRADGEGNNLFFTGGAVFTVDNGISLAEALDQPALTIETSGDGQWFSRDDDGDLSTTDDDQTFFDGDGVQSPAGLAEGERASFAFVSATSQLVRFDWETVGTSSGNVLSVSVNGSERREISGSDRETSVEILVSSGSTVRWTYTLADADAGGTAYVDNLELVPNNLPDLAITDVNYTAGEYVLDRDRTGIDLAEGDPQYLQTKFLDVSVVAENQGEDLSLSGGAFTSADIEVRLSPDDEYGNGDDIILGNFAQVEGDFDEDNLLSFLGPIALGNHIPEGFYYLMVRIDPNDRVDPEFTEKNNFWVSENPDVQITRLPDLVVENTGGRHEVSYIPEVLNFADIVDVDESGNFLTGGRMRVRLNIQNQGLEATDGAESFVNQVNLRGIRRPEASGEPLGIGGLADLPGAATEPLVLGEFEIQDELKGRTETSPGESKAVDLELFLPVEVYFRELIGEDDAVSDYLWFIEVIVDAEEQIEETSTFNTWWAVDFPKLQDPEPPAVPSVDWLNERNGDADDGLFGINFNFPTNEAEWEAAFGVTADEAGTAAEVDNFLAYAFNRNPLDGSTSGTQFPGSFGTTEVEGQRYLSISFDFRTRATDLIYTIEADEDVGFPAPEVLLTITPPYPDTIGGDSLTGAGGLATEANVMSVVDFGQSARISVQDNTDITVSPTRFIRVRVDSVEANPVP